MEKTRHEWLEEKGICDFWQLTLNFLWSFLFFEFHWMGIALFEIIVLWISIFLTILTFAKVDNRAAWLLVPYIAWVSFASILNFYFWDLNRPL
jgi:translocator protein